MWLPAGQIPLGWSAPRAGQGSLLLAGSSWLVLVEVNPFTCIAFSVAVCSCPGRWSPAGWGSPCGWQAGEAPAGCQPRGASPQRSCLSSFLHLGCFAIYSLGNISASLRVAQHFVPLVINLRAGLQGVAENRTGSPGVCLAPVQAVLCASSHSLAAGDKGLNPFSVQTSVTRSPAPKASTKPGLSGTPWGGTMQSSELRPAACFLGELSRGYGQCAQFPSHLF